MRPPRMPHAHYAGLVSCLFVALTGCGPAKAKSPEEALARLRAAHAAKNPTTLWSALDQDTQWSWMSIQRAWREAYDITLSNVPEGPNRDRLQSRFEPGATAENAQQLFAKRVGNDDWAKIAADLAAISEKSPVLDPSGASAKVESPSGPVVFRNAHNRYWGWGYAGLSDRAEELKRMASTDLDNLRKEAADYERAAARGAP